MHRSSVSSSNIRSVGYEPDSFTLEIEFNDGSTYQYYGVPEVEFDAFMNSSSKGRYFNAYIKGRYDTSRV
jgi:hypothetical protein